MRRLRHARRRLDHSLPEPPFQTTSCTIIMYAIKIHRIVLHMAYLADTLSSELVKRLGEQ
jgi:hypothetical protein